MRLRQQAALPFNGKVVLMFPHKAWLHRVLSRVWSASMPVVAAAALAIGALVVFGAAPAEASTVTACGTAPFATSGAATVHCYAPVVTTLQSGTSGCPGSQEYFSRNDDAGIPINWTYTAIGNAGPCISIDWKFSALPGNCTFSFYVPDGFATGTIWFSSDNGNGTPGVPSINENPVTGWLPLSVSPGTFWLHSMDAHGYATLAELGWGSSAQHSLMAICPKG